MPRRSSSAASLQLRHKCTYCRSIFSYAIAKLNHLQRQHASLLISYYDNLSLSSSDAISNSEQWSMSADFTTQEKWVLPPIAHDDEDSLMETEVLQTTVYSGAGVTLTKAEAAALSFDIEEPWNPPEEAETRWYPFSNKLEYRLASWFIHHQVSKTAINEFFKLQLGGGFTTIELTSTYTLREKIDLLHNELGPRSWTCAEVRFSDSIVEVFYYRDPIKIIRYLFRQRLFKDVTVYAPIKEYNTQGERIYSELHTGDWSWETQVGVTRLSGHHTGSILTRF